MKNVGPDMANLAMCACAAPLALSSLPWWIGLPLIIGASLADVLGGES